MPYSDPDIARQAAAERRRKWRQRQKEAGNSTHPERQRNRDAGKPARPERHSKPWLFIDTEGANDPEGVYGDPGRQWTFLLCASSDDGFQKVLHKNRPLTSYEMLWFISGLPQGYKIGGYFLGYDWCQILADLNEPALKTIYGVGEPARAVHWKKWVIRLFNTQMRIISPTGPVPDPLPENLNFIKGYSRIVWDVGKFYQCKLSTALQNWQIATPDEQAFIEEMKSSRSDFSLQYWKENHDELIRYSLLENQLGARLQTKFDQTCSRLGYPLTDWYGAGSMAKSMLRSHHVDKQLDNRAPLARHKRAADDLPSRLPYTYFGGRFEIQAPGLYPKIEEYDLRSAYPASYRGLPCLVHGQWKLRAKPPGSTSEIGAHDLLTVDYRIPRAHVWGPFPHRDRDGSVAYPNAGTDHCVWGEELIAALKMWRRRTGPVHLAGIYPRRWWQYHTDCDCRPFDWIDEVYRQRKQLGKDTAGYPLKLGMNAIYGKTASTLGAAWMPRGPEGTIVRSNGSDSTCFCEPRWAGMITAWTRARLLDGIRVAGGPRSRNVIMLATDALYTQEPISLDLSDRLGGWEHHSFPRGGLLIQPGLYHLRGQDVVSKLKGRGIAFADMQTHIRRFHAGWKRGGAQATVTIPLSPRYMGLRLMLHRGNLAGAWRWETMTRTISFDPSIKRELRAGEYWPRSPDSFRSTEGHDGLQVMFLGEHALAPTLSDDQVQEQLLMDSQVDGGFAL